MAELALDADARFLAIRAETFANIGAYLSYFSLLIPTVAGFRLLTGAYRIPAAYVHVRAVYHQHGVGRCLSRRRPARDAPISSSAWSISAARETGLRAGRDPPAQFRAALGDALQDADDRRL